MESKAGLKRIMAALALAALAACGVDGAPEPPADGAGWPQDGLDRSGAGMTGIGVAGETLYGSDVEI